MRDIRARLRTRRIPVRLLLFGVVAVAAFWLGFLAFGVTRSRILVQRYGYYGITLTFAWALFAGWRVLPAWRDSIRALTRRERWQAVAVVAAATVVAFATAPLNYRILYDEMVLQATASNLHLYREVSTVMRAYPVDGVFVPLDSYLDKRPYFYAYLVSLLHDFTGYREANGFALNLALFPVVLAQLYLLARRLARHGAAIAAVLALGTFSALVQSANGAGMEMLNLAMLLGVMQLAVLYLDAPDERRLAALVLGAVLLAQARYESALFVAPVALVALEGWRRAGRIILPVAGIAAPALLVPYAIHNTYLSGTPLLWELKDNAQTRFDAAHLGPNLEHAVRYLFNLGSGLTNSVWLSAAGLVALGYGVAQLWRGWRGWRTAPSYAPVLLTFGTAIVGNLALLMFYYWGQLDDPTVTRLILPFALLLALCVGYAVHSLDSPPRRLAWVAAGGAVLAYLWTGVIANEQHIRLNTLEDEIQWERRFVAALPPGDRLILTNKSSLPWMLARVPTIGIDHARRRVDALRYQFRDPTFREMLVFQRYRPTSAKGEFQLDPADRLPDWFVLEPIAERRFGTRLDRVSRLVEIRSDPASPPAPAPGASAPSASTASPSPSA
ncbi:hypothetical protein [Opitutus sp. ER46]|uniref:hypothetical protein n=1 Tax=Opitutus sp. ER46 TaxID=2161864 RepID=UPI000D30BE00|nr:hypothetical protein [Opitutus sp. ER46]PTX95542.1 hypothetical protein DB354_08965 [Opitutus sp. ER46]